MDSSMKERFSYLWVALLALAVGVLYLREPGFGDDLTYWMQAFDVHEKGASAWEKRSFHDLRWPVWGICWVLQPIFHYGMFSYWGVSLFYLTIGSLLSFGFARRLLGSVVAGWAGAMAFLFHPLLDSICHRPMPDLSEGVIGAAIVGTWWRLMHSATKWRSALWMTLMGGLVCIAEANRVTGVFVVLVLIVATLWWHRSRFGWLVGAGVVSLVGYGLEAWFYHGLFGTWKHAIEANMNNVANKGTEPMPLWLLPIRFIDSLWSGGPLPRIYFIAAVFGVWPCWRRYGSFGRLVVLWFFGLYFAYSCSIQPAWPIRPLIRDADRFLAGLAIPMSLLAVAGFWWALGRITIPRWLRLPAPAWVSLALLALVLLCKREWFNVGFVPQYAAYLRSLPEGTRVFTHESMRAMAFLCDARSAKKLSYFAPFRILHRTKELEEEAAKASEFWYARKLVWLGARKDLERKEYAQQPKLGSYFTEPEKEWTLTRLLAKGDTPDLIFYRRRTSQTPAPVILDAKASTFGELFPALPARWNKEQGQRETKKDWSVPAELRGKLMRVEIGASSDHVEAFTLRLRFSAAGKSSVEYLFKPYLHNESGFDFFCFSIPTDADACEFLLKFSSRAKEVRFDSFRAVVEPTW
jgi:hypothetical protein